MYVHDDKLTVGKLYVTIVECSRLPDANGASSVYCTVTLCKGQGGREGGREGGRPGGREGGRGGEGRGGEGREGGRDGEGRGGEGREKINQSREVSEGGRKELGCYECVN